MIRYTLQTSAGPVEVMLDVRSSSEQGYLSFIGPEETLADVERDVCRTAGQDGRLLDGPVCAADLRLAMASAALKPYAPKLLEP